MTARDDERYQIYEYLRSAIEGGGCGSPLYISGLPGMGKTTIVREVIEALTKERDQSSLPNFAWVEVNGMQIPKPDHVYGVIWRTLRQKKGDVSWMFML